MRAVAAAIAAFAIALAGCSRSKAPAEAEVAPSPPPPQKTVIDTQLKALQKAKDVQKTVDGQKRDMEQEVKDQEGGG